MKSLSTFLLTFLSPKYEILAIWHNIVKFYNVFWVQVVLIWPRCVLKDYNLLSKYSYDQFPVFDICLMPIESRKGQILINFIWFIDMIYWSFPIMRRCLNGIPSRTDSSPSHVIYTVLLKPRFIISNKVIFVIYLKDMKKFQCKHIVMICYSSNSLSSETVGFKISKNCNSLLKSASC